MALPGPAKACLWQALRFLRAKQYAQAEQKIKDALVFLELDRSSIEQGLFK